MAHLLVVGVTRWSESTVPRALRLGHRVTVALPVGAPAPAGAARVLRWAAGRSVEDVVAAIGPVHAADPIDGVLVRDESALEPVAVGCGGLGVPFTSAPGVRNARNKARARELVAAAGLASVPFAQVDTVDGAVAAANAIGYPVVVKPIRGFDSVGTARADDAATVASAAARIRAATASGVDGTATVRPDGTATARPDGTATSRLDGTTASRAGGAILVERHLDAPLYWVDLAIRGGQATPVAFFRRRASQPDECVDAGADIDHGLPPAVAAGCHRYSAAVCSVLGLDLGLFHLDLAVTAAGPVLIEANPRMMSGVLPALYEYATGTDPTDLAIATHLGARAEPPAQPGAGAAVVRKVMPARPGRLPATLPTAVADPDVELRPYRLRPGTEVGAGEVLAAVLARGGTLAAAEARAAGALTDLERAVGLELVRA